MVSDNGNFHRIRSVLLVVLTIVTVSVFIGGAFGDSDYVPDGEHFLTTAPANSNNKFTNPTFNNSFNGWLYPSSGSVGAYIGNNTAGSNYASTTVGSNRTDEYGWAYLEQTIDVSDVDEITFDIMLYNYQAIGSGVNFGFISINGSNVRYRVDNGTTWYTDLNTRNIFGSSHTKNVYHTLHIDTSSYTGDADFIFYAKLGAVTNENGDFLDESGNVIGHEGDNGTYTIVAVQTTNYTANDPYSPPVMTGVSGSFTYDGTTYNTSTYLMNTSTMGTIPFSATVSYTAGNPAETYVAYTIDDSTAPSASYAGWHITYSNPYTFTIYPSSGYHVYYFWVKNSKGISSNYYTLGVEQRGININTNPEPDPTTGYVKRNYDEDIGLISTGATAYIHDTSSYSTWSVLPSGGSWSPVGNGSSYIWRVDGNSLYSIKFDSRTKDNKQFTIVKNNCINSSVATIHFTGSSYKTTDTAEIQWNIGADYTSTDNYEIRYYPSNSEGVATGEKVYTTPNIGQSGTTTINCAAFVTGYMSAYIFDNTTGRDVAHSVGVPITVVGNLKVILTDKKVTWTKATELTIYQEDGTTLVTGLTPSNPITNITSGEATFSGLTSPAQYVVKAVTDGYSQSYKYEFRINASGLTATLPFDFTEGAGEDTSVGGSGSMYASTYVTFRVIDSGTGQYVSGVNVSATAHQPTTPIDWIANLFGSAWGTKIENSTVSGQTDDSGKVTFAMFPVYPYQMTITYGSGEWHYNFTPTELTTEEIISIPISQGIVKETDTQLVTTTATPIEESGRILVTYNDESGTNKQGTTEKVVIKIYRYINGQKTPTWNVNKGETCNLQVDNTQSFDDKVFQMDDWKKNSFWVDIECYVGAFYTSIDHTQPSVVRSYGITFGQGDDIRIKIGNIPDGMYLVISFGLLVLLGAVGTQVTSRFYAIVVAAVGVFLYWAGWMSSLGVIGEVACTLAFVLAILYYIAGVNQPQ